MASMAERGSSRPAVMTLVRARVERGGERPWRIVDFREQPATAVAKALSRLAAGGVLERLSKGVYYRGRPTPFGASRPMPGALFAAATEHTHVFAAGVSAANLLGLSTQTPRRAEIATVARSLPRKLLGTDVVVHTRRPAAWARLAEREAALLDVLRVGGRSTDLEPRAAVERVQALLREGRTFDNLLRASATESPRVRALLGALGESVGRAPEELVRLRRSLNPLSRFDFGVFAGLEEAAGWQAKRVRAP